MLLQVLRVAEAWTNILSQGEAQGETGGLGSYFGEPLLSEIKGSYLLSSAAMVPDLHPSGDDGSGGVEVERCRFFDTSSSGNGNGISHDLRQTNPATKLIPRPFPTQNGNSFNRHHSFHEQLVNNCAAYWQPLKAIPLASYYKLHRVPSLDSLEAMAEEQEDIQPIELPQSEPTVIEQPQDKVAQDGLQNKILEQVIRTPGRLPSPQPTHLTVPAPGQHRVLHEEDSGYVAPKFEGKEQQMEQGKLIVTEARNADRY